MTPEDMVSSCIRKHLLAAEDQCANYTDGIRCLFSGPICREQGVDLFSDIVFEPVVIPSPDPRSSIEKFPGLCVKPLGGTLADLAEACYNGVPSTSKHPMHWRTLEGSFGPYRPWAVAAKQ
jgi:hypothetical protein